MGRIHYRSLHVITPNADEVQILRIRAWLWRARPNQALGSATVVHTQAVTVVALAAGTAFIPFSSPVMVIPTPIRLLPREAVDDGARAVVWRAMKLCNCRFQSRFISTASAMFGRSKPSTNCSTSPPKSFSAMSSRVTSSAVAVSASIGTPGRRSRNRHRSACSGRNAEPHCEIQWTSSIANTVIGNRASAASMRTVISRSGGGRFPGRPGMTGRRGTSSTTKEQRSKSSSRQRARHGTTARSSRRRHRSSTSRLGPVTGTETANGRTSRRDPQKSTFFGWHPETRTDVAEHRKPEQWVFYVIRSTDLPETQRRIGLSSVKEKRAQRADSDSLAAAIEQLLKTDTRVQRTDV